MTSSCSRKFFSVLGFTGITQAPGWLLFFHSFILCVQVFHSSQLEQKLSWLQAHLFCQRHGANLLSIGSPEEEHFVLQVLHEAFGWVWTAHQVMLRDVLRMMVVLMEMMIWPTGSQKNTSSTGSGSG